MSVARMHGRSRWRAVGLLALALGALALGAAPVAAATVHTARESAVQVSADGRSYGEELGAPLFAQLPTLVPGDREPVTLWVRNAGDIPGVLRLSGTGGWWSGAAFAGAITVSATAAGSTPPQPIALADTGDCVLLLRGPVLQPGESAAVVVTVAFPSAVTGREGAGDSGGLDFVVALRDPAEPATDTADCSSGTVVPGAPAVAPGEPGEASDRMADTGSLVVTPLIVGGSAVVAGLATLVVLARRHARRRAKAGR